jgi:hypothetical protein
MFSSAIITLFELIYSPCGKELLEKEDGDVKLISYVELMRKKFTDRISFCGFYNSFFS